MAPYTYLTCLNDAATVVVPFPDHPDRPTRLAPDSADAEAPSRSILKATEQPDACSRRPGGRRLSYCPFVAVREFNVQEGHGMKSTRALNERSRQKKREKRKERMLAEMTDDPWMELESAVEKVEERVEKEANSSDHLSQDLEYDEYDNKEYDEYDYKDYDEYEYNIEKDEYDDIEYEYDINVMDSINGINDDISSIVDNMFGCEM